VKQPERHFDKIRILIESFRFNEPVCLRNVLINQVVYLAFDI
jgi:hypothetical protein